ncbi:DUF2313 domain-containing protein [Pseudomonas corrugata]|uniref:YmfQ family protein n=1 Tax=Pseudomonas corrugata TaxID=47879 RepID=UPI0006D8D43F|nr:putative phage tail protein [Pseudomonas corrugata]
MTRLADQLRLLLPLEAYDPNAKTLSGVIEAEAAALTLAEQATDQVYGAIFPDTGAGLTDWERVLALPDPCLVGIQQSTQQRINAVVSKLGTRGGQSKPFFIALAKSLGYDITITTFRPAYAGRARAGDPIYGGDWSFAWRVNAPAVTVSHAVAGRTAAGDPLASWGNKSLECRLSQMKPAESILLFGYGAS